MGKHYKYDFKIKIVQEYLNEPQDYQTLTKSYCLSSTAILRRWVDQYLKYGSKESDKN
ncbi:transposase [Staphylococcus pasteuri]|uniref:transposase n=1 Tax=Staphylococcus pasteuri TaxID=45972 RepID=UPI000E69147A|nr:transposase [Staphylococcus pasteuri]RIO54551.1 transposase [Staphylococcus pasteuri]